ncbi:hypothetical protein JHK82_039636 [Glycine max]|nr:hypothetical protein JHK86_039826 [Glycine max]KAG4965428.1 hypothetical protein JHK85_040403 [Glycine max]KAG5110413.1 hypothetical protein JHK82_039636 [Glycine max]
MTHTSFSKENNKAFIILSANVIETSISFHLLSKDVDVSSKELNRAILILSSLISLALVVFIGSMDFRDGAHKLSHCIVTGLTSKTPSAAYSKLDQDERKVRYLAIVIESEEAYQISKVVKLLQWLDSIGVKECVPL